MSARGLAQGGRGGKQRRTAACIDRGLRAALNGAWPGSKTSKNAGKGTPAAGLDEDLSPPGGHLGANQSKAAKVKAVIEDPVNQERASKVGWAVAAYFAGKALLSRWM